jgi:hypothetical protein
MGTIVGDTCTIVAPTPMPLGQDSKPDSDGGEECSICYGSKELWCIIYPCEHLFCWECVQAWLKAGGSQCPLCRSDITQVLQNVDAADGDAWLHMVIQSEEPVEEEDLLAITCMDAEAYADNSRQFFAWIKNLGPDWPFTRNDNISKETAFARVVSRMLYLVQVAKEGFTSIPPIDVAFEVWDLMDRLEEMPGYGQLKPNGEVRTIWKDMLILHERALETDHLDELYFESLEKPEPELDYDDEEDVGELWYSKISF